MALSTLCLLLFLSLTGVINGAGNCSGSNTVSMDMNMLRGFTQEEYQKSIIDYWTPERIASARPMQPKIIRNGNIPFVKNHEDNEIERILTPSTILPDARVSTSPCVGRAFFTYGSLTYWCSGSVINASNMDTVLTAGHCVFNTTSKEWAKNFIFIPAYNNNSRPYGTFTARKLVTTQQWMSNANFSHDMAFAIMSPDGTGTHIQQKAGCGLGLLLNCPVNVNTTVFGYGEQTNNGETISTCAAKTQTPSILGFAFLFAIFTPNYDGSQITCNLEGGSSGGPWFQQYNANTMSGLIMGVMSFETTLAPGSRYAACFRQGNMGQLFANCQNA
ncbi:unnamed protein product [Adineta steineri]|uniref:Peptidase S1 domain-containing protein n=2 Tax=Adineta steineri TaxID=433720 RepID=A0A819MJU4_9BILA|nr:unnamed protein product [Adineta steineri]CAF3980492.1 unnamed protein product [Adineta steineri]